MNDPDDRQLDAGLETCLARMQPPSAPDLAARILFAARHTPQRRLLSLGDWLRALFADCHLPAPSYALAAMLTLGLGMGMLAPAMDADNAETLLWSAADQEILP